MQKEQKFVIFSMIIIFLLIILSLLSFRRSGYVTLRWINWSRFNLFRFFSSPTTTTTLPTGLINDENYVQNQINAFLKNNPNADESYARDVVYRDIARTEKNVKICYMIKDEYLKTSCHNAVV